MIHNDEEIIEAKDSLEKVEELLAAGYIDAAQEELDGIKEKNARFHFVQSKVYKAKKWLNEERKQLVLAIQLEPENEEYRTTIEELEKLAAEQRSKEEKEKEKRSGEVTEDMGGICSVFLEMLCSR